MEYEPDRELINKEIYEETWKYFEPGLPGFGESGADMASLSK